MGGKEKGSVEKLEESESRRQADRQDICSLHIFP